MKKFVYLAVICAAVAALASCKEKKTEKTAALAAKEYTESLLNGDYDGFVDLVVFAEPTPGTTTVPVKPEVKKVHSSTLKAIHQPSVDEKGGVKSVAVASEKVAPDGLSANVKLTNTYNNGEIEYIDYEMIYVEPVWKVKVNKNKEVWTATDINGDKEVIKIKEGANRDFVKTNDDGERQFVKEIVKRDGQVEVVKILENGEHYKEVVKILEEGDRLIEKEKDDAGKTVIKEIDKTNEEVVKAKDHEKGEQTERAKEVIEK